MSMKRIGVTKPAADTYVMLADVNTQYLASVIMTNINPKQTANITVEVRPNGETNPDNYAYVIYNFPLERANSLETHRFALNALDEVWVLSTTEGVSFTCEGIPQPLINVRYTSGLTANYPAAPLPGDLFYDTEFQTLNLYKADGWKLVTTS
jgi:hypothetical protein